MKVYCGKSVLMLARPVWVGGFMLLLFALAITATTVPLGEAIPPQQKAKEAYEKSIRDAKKAIRTGKYEDALKIYLSMIEADARDMQPRLGASFAYLRMQNYLRCFEQAVEANKIDANNARA